MIGWPFFMPQNGRSPYGERGLKYPIAELGELVRQRSLSLRRAWIEITALAASSSDTTVALLTESVD